MGDLDVTMAPSEVSVDDPERHDPGVHYERRVLPVGVVLSAHMVKFVASRLLVQSSQEQRWQRREVHLVSPERNTRLLRILL